MVIPIVAGALIIAAGGLGFAGLNAFQSAQITEQQQEVTLQENQDTLQKELDMGLVRTLSETGVDPSSISKGFNFNMLIPVIVVAIIGTVVILIIKN